QRIDHVTEVIDDRVTEDRGDARVRIDLHLDDVTAVRERRGGRVLHLRGVEPRFHAGRQLCGVVRGFRDIEQIDRPGGADDAELPIAELDVCGRGLQQVRGDLPALVDDLE